MGNEQKSTYITTFRGEITDIATIARFMVQNGVTPRSRNELINCAVTNFVKQLNKTYPELAIIDTGDALEVLTSLNLIGKNLERMQPALAQGFWDSETLSAGAEIPNATSLSKKALTAANQELAGNAMELMQKLHERNERDKISAKEFALTGNAPIAKEET